MTSLLYLTLTGCACASLVLWQQQSINRVRREMAQVSDAIVDLRDATAALDASLARDHARLRQVGATVHATEAQRVVEQAPAPTWPTPDQEGWWPQDHPYFYLAKGLLPKVRFRDRRMSAQEFLVSDSGILQIGYVDQWGNRYFRNESYNLDERNSAFQQAWDYGHLFGPGGPLDLH